MDQEISTVSDVSVAVTQITDGNYVTALSTSWSPSSSRGQFYLKCAVVVIGVVATATNGLVLYALIASKQHKKHVLIVNQNALDLFASFFLTLVYSLKLCNVYLTGSTGYWLCTLLLSESLWSCGIIGSVINLAIVSVERYLKVVHRTWSKKYLRKWIIHSAAAFAWMASITFNMALVLSTTEVIDGACYAYAFWKNKTVLVAHTIWQFVSFYVIVLLIFIFCYWRILAVIRQQASIMAAHDTSGGSSSAPSQSNRIQTSVIKTMIFVGVLYAVTWLPHNVFVLSVALGPSNRLPDSGYYASVVIAFLYVGINPFIYATKFDPVKEILLRMIPCKTISQQATGNVAAAGTGTNTAQGRNTPFTR